ncbi:MAG: TROVE domain-containing protein [Bacteroidia bacterium]
MRFNNILKGKNKTLNHEGAEAWKMTPEMELYTAVVTSTLSKSFYEGEGNRVERIRGLINQVDPEFVAQLAIYAREKMHLRSIPLVLTVELAKVWSGDDLVYRLTKRVLQRADEITELLAYYQLANARTGQKKLARLSKQLQKGIAESFHKFDEYQFAKYNRKTEVSLKDALFLTHPKAQNEKEQILFNKIVSDELEVPYTWEVELSRLGQQTFKNEKQKKAAFRNKWQELIDSGRLGYMALLRNLRNILQAGVKTEYLKIVAKRLSNENEVRRSRQLPFRFLSAYLEMEAMRHVHASYFMRPLEKAALVSVENLKGFGFETKICLAADVSGSMFGPINPRSKIQAYDIGLLLSMLMRARSKAVITGIFGDRWETFQFPTSSVLSNVARLKSIEGRVGYATNGHKVIDDLHRKGLVMDKVMMFTDLQMWSNQGFGSSLKKSWKAYKKLAPEARLYLFDLRGYGKSPISLERDDVALIAGWSDKVFEVLDAMEQGRNALDLIAQIEF